MIAALLARFGPWLAAIAGALAWLKLRDRQNRQEGRDEVRAEQREADARASKERQHSDRALVNLADAQRRERLHSSKYKI